MINCQSLIKQKTKKQKQTKTKQKRKQKQQKRGQTTVFFNNFIGKKAPNKMVNPTANSRRNFSLSVSARRLMQVVRCSTREFLVDYRNPIGYIVFMIKSFKHKGLEKFFFTGNKKGIKPEHATRLERILDRLNAADDIRDMNYPGSNLHKLTGDKQGQHAVNVSGNWRVFFDFINGHAYVVDYDDYH